jgi:hypothetical protein
MKPLGSLLFAILVGVIAIWLFIKLLGLAFKLLGIAIAIALAVGVYFAARKLIGRGGNA